MKRILVLFLFVINFFITSCRVGTVDHVSNNYQNENSKMSDTGRLLGVDIDDALNTTRADDPIRAFYATIVNNSDDLIIKSTILKSNFMEGSKLSCDIGDISSNGLINVMPHSNMTLCGTLDGMKTIQGYPTYLIREFHVTPVGYQDFISHRIKMSWSTKKGYVMHAINDQIAYQPGGGTGYEDIYDDTPLNLKDMQLNDDYNKNPSFFGSDIASIFKNSKNITSKNITRLYYEQYLARNPKAPKSFNEFEAYISDNNYSVLRNNAVVIYDVSKDGYTMTPACYSLPLSFDWHNPETMRQGLNLCPEAPPVIIDTEEEKTYSHSIVSSTGWTLCQGDREILVGLNNSSRAYANDYNAPWSLCRRESYAFDDDIIINSECKVGDHGTGDWAANWFKRECPLGYILRSISNHGATINCSRPNNHSLAISKDCRVQWFNRFDHGYVKYKYIGDWADGSYKLQVPKDSYIGGIAMYNGTNQISSALVCPLVN